MKGNARSGVVLGPVRPPDTDPSVGRRSLYLSLAFVLATLLTFFAYRLVFLFLFVASVSFTDAVRILLSGMRLDIALTAIELLVLLLIFLLLRYVRLRMFALALSALAIVHVALAITNLLFFKERYQHLWETLIANLSHPGEIAVAARPFFEENPATVIVAVSMIALISLCVLRLCRRVPPLLWDLRMPRHRLRRSIAIAVVLFCATFDAVAYRTTKYWRLGLIPSPAASQLYMRFDSYEANQAVINPAHDLVRFYLPATLAALRHSNTAYMQPSEAISVSQSLLGVQPVHKSYPLMRDLPAGPQLGLKNVVLIIAEGLSQSILHRREEGREITPFLNDLTRRGLYFPNLIQSYNATDGSVFSIVTGMYKVFAGQSWKYFLPTELNSYFGSLAYLLGNKDYQHYAMFGFRNRREDFTAFLRNQGFMTFDHASFASALGEDRIQAVGNALGLYDEALFAETERILRSSRSNFTATVITATTHSPWTVADHIPPSFSNSRLNTFRYLDDCIKNFVLRLRDNLDDFDKTLFVITGDHTSVTFGGGPMEHLRVPLIMFSPRLEALASRVEVNTANMASHVDIVPTILQLLDGRHSYSGMGVSLISPDRVHAGVVSNSRFHNFYFRDGFVMRTAPSDPGLAETRLFALRDGEVVNSDVASLHPERTMRMRHEFLALYETSARLIKEKRLIPIRRDGESEHFAYAR